MALTAARMKTDTSVFMRHGRRNQENITRNHSADVCKYWLQGRCTRNPCRFLHPEPDTLKLDYVWKNPNGYNKSKASPVENCGHNQIVLKKTVVANAVQSKRFENNKENCDHNQKKTGGQQKTVANAVRSKRIDKTETYTNLRSWFGDNELSLVAQLEGHSKGVSGIVLPCGSNILYCGSEDKSLRVWDCNSAQCVDIINFDEECGTLVEEGPWIFAGLKNMIKAWNRETQISAVIRANGGMVNAISMFEDTLFAGMEDGTILSWKSTCFSKKATCLKGHTGSVLSLIVGAKMLFSASADRTIRVWDVESLGCTHVLNGHTDDVTSVVCWDRYLLSGSLDKTIKVWGATTSGNIEEVYTHDVDNGVLAFCGMHDVEDKPILLCSCKNNGVRIYDLPSFAERGRIISRNDVKAIQFGPDGLFFTGDAAGLVSVWKPNAESVSKSR